MIGVIPKQREISTCPDHRYARLLGSRQSNLTDLKDAEEAFCSLNRSTYELVINQHTLDEILAFIKERQIGLALLGPVQGHESPAKMTTLEAFNLIAARALCGPQRPLLVGTSKPAVSDHIRRKNGCELPGLCHGSPFTTRQTSTIARRPRQVAAPSRSLLTSGRLGRHHGIGGWLPSLGLEKYYSGTTKSTRQSCTTSRRIISTTQRRRSARLPRPGPERHATKTSGKLIRTSSSGVSLSSCDMRGRIIHGKAQPRGDRTWSRSRIFRRIFRTGRTM
jgi:hypothetical protein